MMETTAVIEFKPGQSQKFVVQAWLESMKAWLTITMPSADLGVLQSAATSFASDIGVNTRIKKVADDPTEFERLSNQIKRNRGVFEPDGYHKRYREMGAIAVTHDIKRDVDVNEHHQALEDFG